MKNERNQMAVKRNALQFIQYILVILDFFLIGCGIKFLYFEKFEPQKDRPYKIPCGIWEKGVLGKEYRLELLP